jgi:molecular chaperone IbpA
MVTYDFSPLLRAAIGFERLAGQIEAAARHDRGSDDPPYNIETAGDDRYRITLAVAGFDQSELDIALADNTLTVTGRKAEQEQDAEYLYRGIAGSGFVRSFELADHVRVLGRPPRSGPVVMLVQDMF